MKRAALPLRSLRWSLALRARYLEGVGRGPPTRREGSPAGGEHRFLRLPPPRREAVPGPVQLQETRVVELRPGPAAPERLRVARERILERTTLVQRLTTRTLLQPLLTRVEVPGKGAGWSFLRGPAREDAPRPAAPPRGGGAGPGLPPSPGAAGRGLPPLDARLLPAPGAPAPGRAALPEPGRRPLAGPESPRPSRREEPAPPPPARPPAPALAYAPARGWGFPASTGLLAAPPAARPAPLGALAASRPTVDFPLPRPGVMPRGLPAPAPARPLPLAGLRELPATRWARPPPARWRLAAPGPAPAGGMGLPPAAPGPGAPPPFLPGLRAPEAQPVAALPLALPAAPALPVLQPERPPPRRHALDSIAYLRRVEKVLDVTRLEETVRRQVEERLEKKVTERVEHVVTRELAPDSPHARRLGERLYAGLYESLLLEKERLG